MNCQIKVSPWITSSRLRVKKEKHSNCNATSKHKMNESARCCEKACLKNSSNELNMSNYATRERGLKINPVSDWPLIRDPVEAKEPDL